MTLPSDHRSGRHGAGTPASHAIVADAVTRTPNAAFIGVPFLAAPSPRRTEILDGPKKRISFPPALQEVRDDDEWRAIDTSRSVLDLPHDASLAFERPRFPTAKRWGAVVVSEGVHGRLPVRSGTEFLTTATLTMKWDVADLLANRDRQERMARHGWECEREPCVDRSAEILLGPVLSLLNTMVA